MTSKQKQRSLPFLLPTKRVSQLNCIFVILQICNLMLICWGTQPLRQTQPQNFTRQHYKSLIFPSLFTSVLNRCRLYRKYIQPMSMSQFRKINALLLNATLEDQHVIFWSQPRLIFKLNCLPKVINANKVINDDHAQGQPTQLSLHCEIGKWPIDLFLEQNWSLLFLYSCVYF